MAGPGAGLVSGVEIRLTPEVTPRADCQAVRELMEKLAKAPKLDEQRFTLEGDLRRTTELIRERHWRFDA